MLQYILKRSDANILPAVKNQTLPINETSICVCTVCVCTVCYVLYVMYCMRACRATYNYKKCKFVFFSKQRTYMYEEKRRIT